jgi:glutamate-ammonia-ligase adenylyltransferase
VSTRADALLDLAASIDAAAAAEMSRRCAGWRQGDLAHATAVLAATAYPATIPCLEADADQVARWLDASPDPGWSVEHFLHDLRRRAAPDDEDQVARAVRRAARQHRLHIALRELLPIGLGGVPFEITARALSDLASATIEIALQCAVHAVSRRFGEARTHDGTPSTFVVLGMGKLGGGELNAGSDIDLVFVYDSDDGQSTGGTSEGIDLHDYWSRVARRLVSLLDEVTEDGFAWRVDLRLRPEGARGPVANSAAAMLRYYETWGRTWERAVLLRASAVAGDVELGEALLSELGPFVFRRGVDPGVAVQLMDLAARARTELGADPDLDLKHAPGGIRDLEMFVQALQLIWGGQDPALRVRNTLQALRRLRAGGFVTDKEADGLDQAYVLLRRAEHFVQNASGLQTHQVPSERLERGRVARALGFEHVDQLDERLRKTRSWVSSCVAGLTTQTVRTTRWAALIAALESDDPDRVQAAIAGVEGAGAASGIAQDLLLLARRPDGLLGQQARDCPGRVEAVLDALFDSADPEQAAHYLRAFLARRRSPAVYASLLGSNQRAARRFITALGASRFLGELATSRTDIADQLLFSRGMPSVEAARQAVVRELDQAQNESPDELDTVAGAVRRARLRVMTEVALADLAGEVAVRDVCNVLTAAAEGALEAAIRCACGGPDGVRGLCVIAVGKLGGREMGYASDLDVLFVFDPRTSDDPDDAIKVRSRQAQRTIRALSAPHEAGPGYELDTRLRPSGSQGVLVTSIGAFARYHGLTEDLQTVSSRGGAAAWERQTLVRARACAGDMDLAQRVMRIAQHAAFEIGGPDPQETHRLRLRMERELSGERGDRYDLKLGRGGLLDIEFAVQVLQMRHGDDRRLWVQNTMEAIDALERYGYLGPSHAATLRGGYEFLRKLEQRLHVVHGTSIHLIERDAPGLQPLARRMGFRDQTGRSSSTQLLDHYRAMTHDVRAAYLSLLGLSSAAAK